MNYMASHDFHTVSILFFEVSSKFFHSSILWTLTDIGLIQVDKIEFNEKVQPIKITSTYISEDQKVEAFGWGRLVVSENTNFIKNIVSNFLHKFLITGKWTEFTISTDNQIEYFFRNWVQNWLGWCCKCSRKPFVYVHQTRWRRLPRK